MDREYEDQPSSLATGFSLWSKSRRDNVGFSPEPEIGDRESTRRVFSCQQSAFFGNRWNATGNRQQAIGNLAISKFLGFYNWNPTLLCFCKGLNSHWNPTCPCFCKGLNSHWTPTCPCFCKGLNSHWTLIELSLESHWNPIEILPVPASARIEFHLLNCLSLLPDGNELRWLRMCFLY